MVVYNKCQTSIIPNGYDHTVPTFRHCFTVSLWEHWVTSPHEGQVTQAVKTIRQTASRLTNEPSDQLCFTVFLSYV